MFLPSVTSMLATSLKLAIRLAFLLDLHWIWMSEDKKEIWELATSLRSLDAVGNTGSVVDIFHCTGPATAMFELYRLMVAMKSRMRTYTASRGQYSPNL